MCGRVGLFSAACSVDVSFALNGSTNVHSSAAVNVVEGARER